MERFRRDIRHDAEGQPNEAQERQVAEQHHRRAKRQDGAEGDERLIARLDAIRHAERHRVVAKWRDRTRRTWVRGTYNGTAQMTALLLLRALVIGLGLWLWWQGQATPGDVTYVLTTFFVIQGYLRDVGMHIRNLQRSVNDMEELVDFHAEPIGVADRAGARRIKITGGAVTFDRVKFH